jgi:hypothetical protein
MSDRDPIPYVWIATTRYRCPLCPVDRDTAAEIESHLAAAHPPDEPSELQRMTRAQRLADLPAPSEAMTRADLEALAAEAGVADPADYPNKAALIEAIAAEETTDAQGDGDGAEPLGEHHDGAERADVRGERPGELRADAVD